MLFRSFSFPSHDTYTFILIRPDPVGAPSPLRAGAVVNPNLAAFGGTPLASLQLQLKLNLKLLNACVLGTRIESVLNPNPSTQSSLNLLHPYLF